MREVLHNQRVIVNRRRSTSSVRRAKLASFAEEGSLAHQMIRLSSTVPIASSAAEASNYAVRPAAPPSDQPPTVLSQLSSAFSQLQLDSIRYDKLVIPLAGIALITAFVLVLIVNYFLHMRRNGFFKRHRSAAVPNFQVNRTVSNDTSRSHLEDRVCLVAVSGTRLATTAEESPLEATSSFGALDVNLDLPPLPSPPIEYQLMPYAYRQQSPTSMVHSSSGLAFESLRRSSLSTALAATKQQQQQLQQQQLPQILPEEATPPPAPSSRGASPKPLSIHRPSTASLRSASLTKGSSFQQESFDSAYEVRLYDEMTFDPSAIVSKALKRAPLLKGETVSEDSTSSAPTPNGGGKKFIPQTLVPGDSTSSLGTSAGFYSRQASMGGDLSPVKEQPSNEHTSDSTISPSRYAKRSSMEPTSEVPVTRPSKIRVNTISESDLSTIKNGDVSNPKQSSLTSLFKEKRVTVQENASHKTPPAQELRELPAPKAASPSKTRLPSMPASGASNRPPPGMQQPYNATTLSSSANKLPSSSTGTAGSSGAPARGPPGRGRASRQNASSLVSSGQVNANMLMGRIGGRSGVDGY